MGGALGFEPVRVLLFDSGQPGRVDARRASLLQRLDVLGALGGQLELVPGPLGLQLRGVLRADGFELAGLTLRLHSQFGGAAGLLGGQGLLVARSLVLELLGGDCALGLDRVIGASHMGVELLLVALALRVDRAARPRTLLFQVRGQPGSLGAELLLELGPHRLQGLLGGRGGLLRLDALRLERLLDGLGAAPVGLGALGLQCLVDRRAASLLGPGALGLERVLHGSRRGLPRPWRARPGPPRRSRGRGPGRASPVRP